MYEYPLEIHQEPSGVWLSCWDIPEMHASGDTLAEAFADATDAMETALSIYVDQRRPIPEAQPRGEPHQVLRLPALTVAKIALWNALLAEDVSKSELARRLQVARPQVDRLLDFLHASKIEHVERALRLLGRRLSLTVEAA
ncbi:type II toxin-antitoxin system HicB family antitoxin [Pseudomonas sp. R5(2019)]|uniref:type II toxin-antitoxin system HicB family antitoxin n=1 Tax=Pseudomonas sp. R5(2019) TaxID=2697566 RepID=UPI0014136A13|nr:type II toxin-antitoxin system HicB family antitoxin [Pseudomonas sp. R5(2019)]NBA93767.1 type II toxin-antitoxin system HicB family antitoxin [Pseudomonas sp. R5(2019)]